VLVDRPPATRHSRSIGLTAPATLAWLLLSLLVAAIHGGLGMSEAFSSPYVIQTDARQYVTWMARFRDPDLFEDDLIANYFEAVSPPGYVVYYAVQAWGGIDPLVLSKVLPLALGLVLTAFAFGLALELLPFAPGAFVSTVIVNQNLWMTDDLVSATPRAFGLPLFVAFLYFLVRRSLREAAIVLVLEALFYPPVAVVSAGTLVLAQVTWKHRRVTLRFGWHEMLMCGVGIAAALLVLAWSAERASMYGPAMKADEAHYLPVFLSNGRAEFFVDDPWEFWITRQRSGILRQPFGPEIIWTGLLLPVVLLARRHFSLAGRIAAGVHPLPEVVLASLVLFALAHAVLFRLYLPSRYTQVSLRLVLAFCAGIVLTVVVHRVARLAETLIGRWNASDRGAPSWLRRAPRWLLTGGAGLILGALLLAPTISWLADGELPDARYRKGEAPAMYEFLARQPKSTLVASVSDVADFIPPLARRSVIISPKYALPYHLGYHRQMEERARDLIRAQYSEDLRDLQDVTREYGADFWLVRRTAFSPEYVKGSWMMDIQPEATDVIVQLSRGAEPALETIMDRCAAFTASNLVMVDATCILEADPEDLEPGGS
jgi:hypothetical protein